MADEPVGPYQIPKILSDDPVERVRHSSALATSINNAIATGKTESYADAAAYTDSMADTTITSAKTYADTKDAENRALWRTEDDEHEAAAISAARTYTDGQITTDRARMSTIEGVDRRQDLDITQAREYVDERADDLERQISTSHVALDSDGTPFFMPGSMTVKVLQDTDGTPYYEAA